MKQMSFMDFKTGSTFDQALNFPSPLTHWRMRTIKKERVIKPVIVAT
jgi:hypothetical protein